jgi:hypothetical protein
MIFWSTKNEASPSAVPVFPVDAIAVAVTVFGAVVAAVTSRPLVLLDVRSLFHGDRSIRRRMAFLGLANELNGQAGEVCLSPTGFIAETRVIGSVANELRLPISERNTSSR